MTAKWEGQRITNRLQIWSSDEMPGHWTIQGKEENNPAEASAEHMVKLARAILKNLKEPGPKPPEGKGAMENGRFKLPLNIRKELKQVYDLNESAIDAFVCLWLDPFACNGLAEIAKIGATLRALGDYLTNSAVEMAASTGSESVEDVIFGDEIDLPFVAKLTGNTV